MTKKSSKREDRTRFPLPTPIDDGSRICVKVYIPNILEHRNAFQGAILNLAHWYSWTLDDAKRGREAALVWSDIYDQMMETFYDGCPDDKPCHDFAPSAGFIEYFPNNPYTTPDFVGEGYNAPAWYLATATSNLLLGTQYGDVATDLSRFPPGSLPSILPASGLPRIRINLVGEGLVRLYLLNLFGGSLAQITVDDDLGTLRFIDSDRDQIAAPFETATETITEVEITGAGAHHIDIIIVSQINDSIPFLHHGGGLRKVELCGFESMVTMPAPVFRFTAECILEVSYNGVDYDPVPGWTEFATDCFTGAPGEPGEPGEPGTPGEPGEPGEPGAAGTNASIRCAVAEGTVRGMIDEFLVPMLDAIISGIEAEETPEGIETLALEQWYELTPGSICEGTFSTQVNSLVELDDPEGTLEIYRSAIADEPFKLTMIRGVYCWLCENGTLDPDRLGEFTSAVESLFPDSVPHEIFLNWFFVALECSTNDFSAMIARRSMIAGCVDCSELNCDDWNFAFTSWTHDFLLHEEVDGWTPVGTGFAESKWVSGHGMAPVADIGDPGNKSCVAMISDDYFMLLSHIDIGLETAYGAPGHIKVSVQRVSDDLWQDYEADFLATDDFFSIEYTGEVAFHRISIQITRTDDDCQVDLIPQPYIRYVTVKGQNPSPF